MKEFYDEKHERKKLPKIKKGSFKLRYYVP